MAAVPQTSPAQLGSVMAVANCQINCQISLFLAAPPSPHPLAMNTGDFNRLVRSLPWHLRQPRTHGAH